MRLLIFFFAFGLLTTAIRAHSEPKIIRVHMVSFTMAQEVYTELMNRQNSSLGDYAAVRQLEAQGRATVADVVVLTTSSGELGSVESMREFIYPVEYEMSELSQQGAHVLDLKSPANKSTRSAPPVVFETRNLGVNVEVCPVLVEDGVSVDVSIKAKLVDPVGFSKWSQVNDQWGKVELKHPIFLSHESNTAVILSNGEFSMLNTHTPKNAKGELDSTQKLLVFAMAEIIKVAEHPKSH